MIRIILEWTQHTTNDDLIVETKANDNLLSNIRRESILQNFDDSSSVDDLFNKNCVISSKVLILILKKKHQYSIIYFDNVSCTYFM